MSKYKRWVVVDAILFVATALYVLIPFDTGDFQPGVVLLYIVVWYLLGQQTGREYRSGR